MSMESQSKLEMDLDILNVYSEWFPAVGLGVFFFQAVAHDPVFHIGPGDLALEVFLDHESGDPSGIPASPVSVLHEDGDGDLGIIDRGEGHKNGVVGELHPLAVDADEVLGGTGLTGDLNSGNCQRAGRTTGVNLVHSLHYWSEMFRLHSGMVFFGEGFILDGI